MKRTKQGTPEKETPRAKLADQMKKKVKANKTAKASPEYDGTISQVVSTGSTLLDLAISGGRVRGGGVPTGIFVEVFGPKASGKTVLLCEMAGAVQRQGGQVMFHDPEARLNKQFAQMFDLDTEALEYDTPDTIPEVFNRIRAWEPSDSNSLNGVFADSLAALSTDMEMEKDEGDKMGMRRAKEFSEELRKTCRIIKQKNLLLVGSNQVRHSQNSYGPKYIAPGGEALGFYASLRLRFGSPQKIKVKKTIQGKEVEKVIGVTTEVEVEKSSVWEPYHTAPLTIIFDYGIDSIRDELQFIKDHTKNKVYTLDGENLHTSMEKSIRMVEERGPEAVQSLREEVIDLWEDIQQKFKTNRSPKIR